MVLWELASRKRPFASINRWIIGHQISKGVREQIPEGCDKKFSIFIEKCWSHVPSNRPALNEILKIFEANIKKTSLMNIDQVGSDQALFSKNSSMDIENPLPLKMKVAQANFMVGQSSFLNIVQSNGLLIDKSLLIKAVLDDSSLVKLILRPRRFGKTFNMSMLEAFFSNFLAEKTLGVFQNLNIGKENEIYLKHHQGQYPVIFLTFKDIKASDFSENYQMFKILISEVYEVYRNILFMGVLKNNNVEQKKYNKIIGGEANEIEMKQSLRKLMQLLNKQYNRPVIVLIDEYDTPISASYVYNHYKEMVNFVRDFLSPALKDNPNLAQAILTGILRVARESIFSGLNNLRIYSMLSEQYAPFFGFTSREVEALLGKEFTKDRLAEIEKWYGGYRVGTLMLYNPWSIINYIVDKQTKFDYYWINTSTNQLIIKMLKSADRTFKDDCHKLIENSTIVRQVDEHVGFHDLDHKDHSALWSFLLLNGYLASYTTPQMSLPLNYYHLFIPNQEVYHFYRQVLVQWFGKSQQWTFSNPVEKLFSKQSKEENAAELKTRIPMSEPSNRYSFFKDLSETYSAIKTLEAIKEIEKKMEMK